MHKFVRVLDNPHILTLNYNVGIFKHSSQVPFFYYKQFKLEIFLFTSKEATQQTHLSPNPHGPLCRTPSSNVPRFVAGV